MRNSLAAIVLFSMAIRVSAQQSFSVIRHDADSRVWVRTNIEMTSGGHGAANVNQYTELATGMYYTNNAGEWLESREHIDILPQGGASATRDATKFIFQGTFTAARLKS